MKNSRNWLAMQSAPQACSSSVSQGKWSLTAFYCGEYWMFYIRGRNRKGLLSASKIILNQPFFQERKLTMLFSSPHVAPAGKVHPETWISGPDRNRKWGHRGALQRGLRRRGRLRWLRRRRAPEKHPKSLQTWVSSSCNLSNRQLINLSKAPEHDSGLRRFGWAVQLIRLAKWECDAAMSRLFPVFARGLVWVLICSVMLMTIVRLQCPRLQVLTRRSFILIEFNFLGKTKKISQWWWNTSNQNYSRRKRTRKKKI